MPVKTATTSIKVPISTVFNYLNTRYESENYHDASRQSKGYVPRILKTENCCKDYIEYFCKARDTATGLNIFGWTWAYELTEIDTGTTRIKIWYKYGWLMEILSLGMISPQASNEITETVLALDALEFKQVE